MLSRILEPEVMESAAEAADYDAMDHEAVNDHFVNDWLAAADRHLAAGPTIDILDLGTGTARIPVRLAQRRPDVRIVAADLAEAMLEIARKNIAAASLQSAIRVQLADAKALTWADETFDCVISNSIVHHIPHPVQIFREIRRVVRRGGLIFIRDLLRPDDSARRESLVKTYAGDATAAQRRLFRDSLQASLNLSEVQELLVEVGLPPEGAQQSSDRHWTVCVVRPAG